MAADNIKRFDFRLGKWGLTLFVFAMSLLLLSSFLFGIKVGKDMDVNPEKYSWGMLNKIGETAGEPCPRKSGKTVIAVRDAGKENLPSEKSEYDLSFYDTLSKKSNSLRKQPSGNGAVEEVPGAPAVVPGKKAAAPAEVKKEEKTAPPVPRKGEVSPQQRTEEKPVVKAVPEKVREVKAPPEVKKAEPKPEKAVAAEKKAEGAIEKIIAADRSQVKKEIKPATQTFMVQVGSYRDKAKADQVAAKMKALGYAPRVVPMEFPGQGKWYRLTIGGFPSREKAAEAVTNAAKSTGSRGFIRPEGEAKAAVPPSPVKKK